jgi:hypothetical protein
MSVLLCWRCFSETCVDHMKSYIEKFELTSCVCITCGELIVSDIEFPLLKTNFKKWRIPHIMTNQVHDNHCNICKPGSPFFPREIQLTFSCSEDENYRESEIQYKQKTLMKYSELLESFYQKPFKLTHMYPWKLYDETETFVPHETRFEFYAEHKTYKILNCFRECQIKFDLPSDMLVLSPGVIPDEKIVDLFDPDRIDFYEGSVRVNIYSCLSQLSYKLMLPISYEEGKVAIYEPYADEIIPWIRSQLGLDSRVCPMPKVDCGLYVDHMIKCSTIDVSSLLDELDILLNSTTADKIDHEDYSYLTFKPNCRLLLILILTRLNLTHREKLFCLPRCIRSWNIKWPSIRETIDALLEEEIFCDVFDPQSIKDQLALKLVQYINVLQSQHL